VATHIAAGSRRQPFTGEIFYVMIVAHKSATNMEINVIGMPILA
jgi:hypothetical protein